MKLFNEIIDCCDRNLIVNEVIVGVRTTLVRSLKSGLSSTFRNLQCYEAHTGLKDGGALTGIACNILIKKYRNDDLTERSVAVAALNAIVQSQKRNSYQSLNAFEIILRKATGKNAVVVGQFPFVKKLESVVNSLMIINEIPENGWKGVEKARDHFPSADVIAITGSAMINGTMADLLNLARGKYVIVLGASTPMSSVMFDWGVDALCGTVVEDVDRVRDYVLQGASFRNMKGIRRVTWIKDEC